MGNKQTKGQGTLATRLKGRLGQLPFGSFLVRLVAFFTAFFLVIQAMNWQTQRFLEKASVNVLRESYTNIATSVAFSLNSIFLEVYQSNSFVGLHPASQAAFTTGWALESLEDYADVPGVIRLLGRVSTLSEYIENVAIIKRDSGIVITDTSLYTMAEYFGEYNAYDGYPESFWQEYTPDYPFQVMEPMTVRRPSGDKRVLPVVQNKVYNIPSRNLYVVDLDMDKIEAMLDNYRATQNSVLMITTREPGQLLFSQPLPEGLDTGAFLAALPGHGEDSGKDQQFHYGGQEYFFFSFDADMFFTPVVVNVCIPQNDLTEMIRSEYSQRGIFNVLVVLLAVLMIALFSYVLYEPLRILVGKLAGGPGNKRAVRNELRFIQTQFEYIHNDLLGALNEAEFSSQLAGEQLLHKLFNGQPLTPQEETHLNALLGGAGVRGAFLLIKPVYRDALHQAYTAEFTEKLFLSIKNVITGFFARGTDCHVFEVAANRICVLAAGTPEARLAQRADELLHLFEKDAEHLALFVAKGGGFTNAQGLVELYRLGENALASLSPYHASCIVDAALSPGDETFELGLEMENKLNNLLVAGRSEELMRTLENEVLATARLGDMPVQALQRLFMQLYFVAAKALRENGRVCSQKTYERFMDFSTRLDGKTPGESRDFLLNFFLEVTSQFDAAPLTLSSGLFRDYIDSHYNVELTLDSLAKKYNTSPQYISRLLKKELGMSFNRYLHLRRVERAKQLLLETNLSIDSIRAEVGYNSRNTFIRSFKNVEGISPSEYRSLWREKKP